MNTDDNTEKRGRIIELRNQGKTIRVIAKELGMSSRTVIGILNDNSAKDARAGAEKKNQEQQYLLQTNYTRALRLFRDGISLLDVTIDLGVFAEETKRTFFDYQEINGLDNFRGVYEDIRSSLPALLTLWGMMTERGLGVKDALVAIEYASDRAKAERELQFLTNKVADMENRLRIQNLGSNMQLSESQDNRPPSIPKAAASEVVTIGD